MTEPRQPEPRQPAATVDPLFVERYSPRAFAPTPVDPADLAAIFEAARWSMSAFNGQPWRIVYATAAQPEDHARLAGLLVDANRRWAEAAPVLGFVFAKIHDASGEKVNRWADFDTGSSFMALSLATRLRGLYSHAMAGIHTEAVYPTLGVDAARYRVICGFALGHLGDAAALPDDLRAREAVRSGRHPGEALFFEGRWPAEAGPDAPA